MTFKTIALAGAAVLALTGVATAGTPSGAGNAQERQITAQLNEQQLNSPGYVPDANGMAATGEKTKTQSVAMNDDAKGASDGTSTNASASDTAKSSPPPTTKTGQVATEAGNEVERASGVKEPISKAELRSAVAVDEVSDPAQTLRAAELKNRQGQAVGQVHKVEVGSDGKVAAIDADVGGFLGVGEKVVSLDPSDLVYLKSRNLLVTEMSKSEIEKLPAAKNTD